MQDIDFDEIDKAVASVNTPTTPSPSPDKNEPTKPTPPATASSPDVRRSQGRFMDVMHRSSAMRPVARETVQREEPVKPPTQDTMVAPVEKTSDDVLPESPFITGAKVEKRPLGTPDYPAPEENPSQDPNGPDNKVSEGPTVLENNPDTPLPTELHPELLQIESKLPEKPAVEDEKPAEAESKDDTPTGPTSITPQYKEQPSTTDQPSGAMYDTESYHTPLTHQPQKKSVWLFVLWGVALVLVGGGIGAAVYFFVLPTL